MRAWPRAWRWGAALLAVFAAASLVRAAAEERPEEVLRRYLQALKDHEFAKAYDYVSAAMRGGKDRDTWAKEQRYLFKMSGAKIFSFQVFPGKIEGDHALVPNLLSSQDRFLNTLAVPEHELYTLVREGGHWKVDRQRIVDPPDIPRWFPAPKAPAEGGKGGGQGAPAGGGGKK